MLKRILIVVGVLVVLVVAAVAAVPFLVSKEERKRLVIAQVQDITGRTLTLAGDLDVQVLPVLAVTAGDVSIGNPAGMAGNLAEVDALIVELDWMSLLSRKLVVNRFVLDRPHVALQVDADGRGNWDFHRPEAAPAPPADRDAAPPAADSGSAPAPEVTDRSRLEEFQFTGVEIRDGRFSFTDAAGASQVADNLNLTLELPGLRQPMNMTGSGRVNGTDLAFAGSVGELQGLMQGRPVASRLSLSSQPATLLLEGQLTAGEVQAFTGRIEAGVPSLPALLILAGQDPAAIPPALDRLDLKAQLDATAGKIALDDLALALGELALSGRLVVEPQEARPRLAGQLSTGVLNLDLLLPPAVAAPGQAPAGGGSASGSAAPAATAPSGTAPAGAAPAATAGEPWPDTPLDASPLSLVDLDLILEAEGLRSGKFDSGPLELSLALSDRNLIADLTRMALYGGNATAQLNVNARGGAPQFALNADLSGIQAEPVLAGLADFDRLAGLGGAKAALTSSGATLRQAVANLAGQGSILFRDGSIKGINIGQALRAIGSGFREPFSGPHQATDFSELSASYTISGGILSSSDLSMKSPLLRVGGEGSVSIIGQTVDYRLLPELVPTAAGQGGAERLAGVTVPLLIRGPLADPSITPDIQGMAVNLLQNPEAAVEQLRSLGGTLPGRLGEVLGGPAGTTPAPDGQAPAESPRQAVEDTVRGVLGGQKDPAETLRGLFNR